MNELKLIEVELLSFFIFKSLACHLLRINAEREFKLMFPKSKMSELYCDALYKKRKFIKDFMNK